MTAVRAEPTRRLATGRTVEALLLGVAFLAHQLVLAGFIQVQGLSAARLGWDAEWYLRIAEDWYPRGAAPGLLPDGFQAYAFHPLYPLLLRGADRLPGVTAGVVAPWLNLAFATVAVVLLARWVHGHLGRAGAVTVVVALAAWPSSPVFQMGYTEGLALLLLVVTWQWVSEGRHALATASIVTLSLARPLAVPLAATIAVLAALRWWRTRDWRDLRGSVLVVGAAAVATVLWPVYAGWYSGDPMMYLEAHNSFAREGAPISPAAWALREPVIAVLVLCVLTVTTAIGLRLLPEGTPALMRAWVLLYPPYLVLGSLVTSSLLRYFMLAFPAALAFLPLARRRVAGPVLLVLALVLGTAGAWVWVRDFMPPDPDGVFP